MKILFVAEFFPKHKGLLFTGGVEAYNYFLVKELSKRHEVIVICRNGIEHSNQEITKDFRVIRIGSADRRIDTGLTTLGSRMIFLLEGLRLGLNVDFDIVQGNNFVTYPLAFLLGFFKRKPSVAWYPDVFIGRWIKLVGFFSGIVGEITERISLILPWTHIVALSKTTKDKLKRVGINDKNISLIYAGVDLDFFKKIRVKKNNIFTICCISRLVGYKRVDLLIRAVAILQHKGYKFKVYIIGDGPEKNNLMHLTEKLSLESSIIFESNIPRVKLGERIKSSHLFCHPSVVEGFGLVLLEAAACGIPIVASDIMILKEITRERKGVVFFRSDNTIDLASKIELMIKNVKLRRNLSKQVLNLATEYSWSKVAQNFENVYSKLTDKKIKILMLVDAWFPHIGGGQVHVWELSKKLAEKGCQISIFSRDLGKWDKKYSGVEVIRVGNHKKFAHFWGRLEFLFLALIYSLKANYDILHTHAFSPGLVAPFIKFFRNKPVVYTVHGKGYKISGLGFGESILEDIVTYKIPYDLEISVAKNTIIKKASAKKLLIIPNGVDINRFSKARRKRKEINRILYVGRLFFDKGVDILIEAFKILKIPGVSLTIVGEGPEEKTLKKISHGDDIKFNGKLEGSGLINAYKKADMLVMPSRVEGMPVRLLEAWAAGLPVLATKVGDNGRYIKEGINGFLSKPDIESLRNGIRKVLRNKSLDKIIANGEKNVKNYSWDIIAEETLKGYRQLL